MKKILAFIFALSGLGSASHAQTVDELWNLYNAGNYDLVIEKMTPLLHSQPDNLLLNLLAGRTYTEKGETAEAIPYLNFTVKNDLKQSWPKAWALAYLGTCHFIGQNFDDSKNALHESITLNATKNATKYALDRRSLFGFDDFYKTWKIIESENFRFHFQNMSNEDIETYVQIREKAFNEINQFFNSSLPKKIDFFVWDSREDAKQIVKAELGFSKPEYCVIHTYYMQTIGHEMTHVISDYTSVISNKSKFINEGTAVCFDLAKNNKLTAVKEWLRMNGRKITVKELWQNEHDLSDDVLYPLSGLFVRDLIDKFGKEKYLEFFKNQTFENAKAVFGEALDQVITDFELKVNS